MTLKPNLSIEIGSSRPKTDPEYVVLGGGHLGASVARRLEAAGHTVAVIDEMAVPEGIPGVAGSPNDVDALSEAGVSADTTVVVATPNDSRNLLIAGLVRAHFDATEIVVLVNAPDRYGLFADVGHEPVCATTALAETLVETIEPAERDREPPA